MNRDSSNKLTSHQTTLLNNEMKGLYRYLEQHPAMNERRLQIGSVPPTLRNEVALTLPHDSFQEKHTELAAQISPIIKSRVIGQTVIIYKTMFRNLMLACTKKGFTRM